MHCFAFIACPKSKGFYKFYFLTALIFFPCTLFTMTDISASSETNREDLEEQRKDQELDICRQIFRNHFFPSKVRIISTRILPSRYLIVGKVNGTMKTFSFNFNREARFVEHEDAESDSEEDSEESDDNEIDEASCTNEACESYGPLGS